MDANSTCRRGKTAGLSNKFESLGREGKRGREGKGGSGLCSHFRHPTCVNTVRNGHPMDTCCYEIGPYVLRIHTPF